jgi:multiple sugar transport system ATP-binding protein
MATVQLNQIRKSFEASEIIKGVDLTIHDQELTVFVGPSGCGKSTLLRLIAGLEEITSGDLLIDGQRVNDVPPAKRGLALVFQSYALYPHMNVAENMSFSLKLAGIPKAEREKKVAEAARILNLETYLERKPKELSGGQRQRVAIGRAIVRNPKVFLFDEPLSNLDAALRVRMRLELTRLHRQLRATMIYVTHDQVEAMTMADRIVVMHSGIIEQVGSPMELYRRPRNLFVAGFIGSPRMNFLEVAVQQTSTSGITIAMGNTILQARVDSSATRPGDKITLGIRPEHIRLAATTGLPAQVQAVEHLGGESYLHLQTASGEALTVRVNGETEVRVDQQVHLEFDPAFLHLFDKQGDAIKPIATDSTQPTAIK